MEEEGQWNRGDTHHESVEGDVRKFELALVPAEPSQDRTRHSKDTGR